MNPIFSSILFIVAILILISVSSCKHEALFSPAEPMPPGENQIDTSGVNNPDDDPVGIPCDEDSIYFEIDVLPILVSNCALSGCHDAQTATEGVILDSYFNVLATTELTPFQPDESEIYKEITETDPDKIMPPPGQTPLTVEQINVIAQWILQGALDLSCDANSGGCDTLDITYSQQIFPLIQNKCLGCHSGNNPGGGLNFSAHAGIQGPALDGSLLGALRHDPGYTAMPLNGNRLSDCDIQLFEIWIAEGAPEN